MHDLGLRGALGAAAQRCNEVESGQHHATSIARGVQDGRSGQDGRVAAGLRHRLELGGLLLAHVGAALDAASSPSHAGPCVGGGECGSGGGGGGGRASLLLLLLLLLEVAEALQEVILGAGDGKASQFELLLQLCHLVVGREEGSGKFCQFSGGMKTYSINIMCSPQSHFLLKSFFTVHLFFLHSLLYSIIYCFNVLFSCLLCTWNMKDGKFYT